MRKSIRRSADQWQTLVDRQKQSNLSVTQFCEQHDLGYASFCQWRKRLGSASSDAPQQLPSFLAVEPPAHQPDNSHWVVELQLSPQIVLRIGKL